MPRPMRLASFAALLLAVTPACVFYSDDDDCDYGGDGVGSDEAYYPGQRNPDTGVCEYFGGGGGGGCGDPCRPCPAGEDEGGAQAPAPTWGFCESQCTGLDQATCTETSGCRAIYTSECIEQPCAQPPVYAECWAVDMTGPIQGGGCEGLDATTCSMHDDCAAVHHPVCDGLADALACTVGTFGYCTGEGGGGSVVGSCEGEVLCDGPTPACPDGTTPGIGSFCYTGYCIPLADCDNPNPDPGACYAPVTCEQAAPDCPEGTAPGIDNGCYTDYCIPLEQCEAQAACASIEAEATCIARTDCTPIYRGEDCSCDGSVCDCASWIYESCE
jgi:hypothetical protein